MKALYIAGPGRVELREVPAPVPGPGECLIRLRQAGICGTDRELLAGYQGFTGIPGHELVGVVEDGPEHLRGRRVVGEINVPRDLGCYQQPGFDPRHHPDRTVLGIRERPGAFAEMLCLPPQNLLLVPDEVSDDQAVFTEPLAAALAVLDHIDVQREQGGASGGGRALVIGDGKLGLLVARGLVHAGLRTTLHGHHPSKLAIARRWGIEAVRVAPGEDLSGHEPFPFIVEVTGSPGGLAAAFALVRPRGTIVLKSTYAPGREPTLDATRMVVDEVRLVGSRCGRFAPALRLLAEGRVDVASLISHRFDLAQGVEAFAAAARPDAMKILLTATP